jgi:hypothetical protein
LIAPLALAVPVAVACVSAWADDDVPGSQPPVSAASVASAASQEQPQTPPPMATQTQGSAPAQAQRPAGLAALAVERQDGALQLSVQLDFSLPSAVRQALVKGVPVYFIAEASIVHPRWYWTDQQLGQARRYWRLSYLPLTRRWQLASSSEPLPEEGIGIGLTQHYNSLDSALAALQRITGWRVADAAALEDGGRQILAFSFRINTAQLPRALQIGMTGQSDWRLRIEQHMDLAQIPRVQSAQDAAP